MEVEFAEEQLVLMPEEERVVNVTFKVKKPGTYSGNIVSVFNSVNEQSSSAIGSTVGLRLNSKVSIVAESKSPSYISIDSVIALGVVAIFIELFLAGRVLYKGKRRTKKEEKR